MPVKMVTAMALANAGRVNLCLVVLMVPFIVDYRLNDTVDVFTQPAAQASPCRVWDLVVYRTLGLYCISVVVQFQIQSGYLTALAYRIYGSFAIVNQQGGNP